MDSINPINLISEDYPPRGKIERDLFLGRLQPLHLGHVAAIKMMKNNPLIIIVKGKGSSEERKKNPFDEEYQVEMVKKVFHNIEVSISPNAFIPGVLGYYRKKGQEITRIFAGPDRFDSYRKQIDSANQKMEPQYHYQVEFIETPRLTSATKVRETLKNKDEGAFKKLMPPALWGEFNKMSLIYSTVLSESSALSFKHWLNEEDGSMSATTTVGSIDISERPWLREPFERGIRRMLGFDRKSDDDIDQNYDDADSENEQSSKESAYLKLSFFR